MEALYKMLLNLEKPEANNAHAILFSQPCRVCEELGSGTLTEQLHTGLQNNPPGALSFAIQKQLHTQRTFWRTASGS